MPGNCLPSLILSLICPRGSPFIPETSQKCIGQDGLQRRRTETRKTPTDSPELVGVPSSYQVGKQGKKPSKQFTLR